MENTANVGHSERVKNLKLGRNLEKGKETGMTKAFEECAEKRSKKVSAERGDLPVNRTSENLKEFCRSECKYNCTS